MSKNKHTKLQFKQKMRLSQRQILVRGTICIFAMVTALTVTFNFTDIRSSLAGILGGSGSSIFTSYESGFENGLTVWSKAGASTWSSSPTKYRAGTKTVLSTASSGGGYGKLYKTYVQNISGITSFSPFSVGDSKSALPVELTSFDVTKEQNIVRLEWNTASEINNDHFEVERSIDAVNWDKLSIVTGSGTTLTPQQYSYIDHDEDIMNAKTVCYRLKQVDFNGKFEFSPVKKISLGHMTANSNENELKVWYNPSQGRVFANVSNTVGSAMQASLINIIGQTISRQYIAPQKGSLKLDFDISMLANGVYSVIIEGGGIAKAAKIIKN
jgi:hypothetical protein